MTASMQLPPSGRDIQVYQRVVVDAISTRQAASESSLSQTRVRQIVQRVIEWLATALPAESELSEAAQLRVARHLAADRLEYFYGEAMRGWREYKQPKYASLALRVIAAQSKLPVIAGTIEALAADAIDGPLPDENGGGEEVVRSPREKRRPTSAPPARDCSAPPAAAPPVAARSAFHSAATPKAETAYDELPAAVSAARRAFFGTAQPPAFDDDSPVAELKLTGQSLGLSIEKTLSRRERRALKRARAKAS